MRHSNFVLSSTSSYTIRMYDSVREGVYEMKFAPCKKASFVKPSAHYTIIPRFDYRRNDNCIIASNQTLLFYFLINDNRFLVHLTLLVKLHLQAESDLNRRQSHKRCDVTTILSRFSFTPSLEAWNPFWYILNFSMILLFRSAVKCLNVWMLTSYPIANPFPESDRSQNV